MKDHSTYLILFILFFTVLSCSKEETPPKEEEPIDTPQLSLIYPLQEDDVHYCCFVMKWEDSQNEGKYRVQISKSSYTQDVLFDTVVTQTSLEFPTTLSPSEEYYWKVIPENIDESQSGLFKITDYISKLMGSYEASINLYSWLQGEGSMDTTHLTNLKIYRGDDHTLTYETDHTYNHPELPFVPERHEDFVLYEIDHNYPPNTDYLKYYFENDSIIIYSSSGGNAGGGNRTIKALHE